MKHLVLISLGLSSLIALFLCVLSSFPQQVSAHEDDLLKEAEKEQKHDEKKPTKPETFTVKSLAIPTTNWTVTASDQDPSYPASNVLDNNPNTIWHSAFAPTTTPLPHTITIDMQTIRDVSGMTYLPRQDASPNGTVGRYSLAVSADGMNWGVIVATGTWADDRTKKTAVFPSVKARFVRLTALTEAGNRGPWSSASEITLFGDPPQDPPLPRNSWVASASDAASGYAASNVLDGNAGTLWHTIYSPSSTPLPHSIVIDMRATKNITGLTYLPRQDSFANGTIGQYSISVSLDNTNWGSPVTAGTWSDDRTQKIATFPRVSARYVRLTALSEAGNRGTWSSASEIEMLGPSPAPHIGGKWDAPIGFPIVPVSAIALPNNKLLTFAGYSGTAFNQSTPYTQVAILDLTTGIVEQATTVNTNHQMFCTGLTVLPDGRILIDGGSTDRATTIYNHKTSSWTQGPLLNIARAYQGDTLTSNGQVFTIGGSWADSAGGKDAELFTVSGTTGSWRRLLNVPVTPILTADPGGVYRSDNHAWVFGIANGGVFHAGPSKRMNWITTSGDGSITNAGLRSDSQDSMNGNAAMYDVGKIITLGGALAYQDAGTLTNIQAHRRAYKIDISKGPSQPPVTTRVSDMNYARAFSSSVVLPDGKVLVMGGQQHPAAFTDTGAALSPELWDPATGSFTIMAGDFIPRTYHSVAILLPDARVFSGGGGLCGNCTTNHMDGRIFTPPYLLNSNGTVKPRPSITSAPTSAAPGSTISITTNTYTPRVVLIRASAITHSVNNDQRRIPLTRPATTNTTFSVTIPNDRGVTLPGTYMLFALDQSGTPSVGKFIQIN